MYRRFVILVIASAAGCVAQSRRSSERVTALPPMTRAVAIHPASAPKLGAFILAEYERRAIEGIETGRIARRGGPHMLILGPKDYDRYSPIEHQLFPGGSNITILVPQVPASWMQDKWITVTFDLSTGEPISSGWRGPKRYH